MDALGVKDGASKTVPHGWLYKTAGVLSGAESTKRGSLKPNGPQAAEGGRLKNGAGEGHQRLVLCCFRLPPFSPSRHILLELDVFLCS